MSSPLRMYNFINRITKLQSAQLINLTKVSHIELENKKIILLFMKKMIFLECFYHLWWNINTHSIF
jgi:hypothetical protein